jgi:hypothetical protein
MELDMVTRSRGLAPASASSDRASASSADASAKWSAGIGAVNLTVTWATLVFADPGEPNGIVAQPVQTIGPRTDASTSLLRFISFLS